MTSFSQNVLDGSFSTTTEILCEWLTYKDVVFFSFMVRNTKFRGKFRDSMLLRKSSSHLTNFSTNNEKVFSKSEYE